MRILGIDPGSHVTGYGIIEKEGNYLRHVLHGEIKAKKDSLLSTMLISIYQQLSEVITQTAPQAYRSGKYFLRKKCSQFD